MGGKEGKTVKKIRLEVCNPLLQAWNGENEVLPPTPRLPRWWAQSEDRQAENGM